MQEELLFFSLQFIYFYLLTIFAVLMFKQFLFFLLLIALRNK